MSALEANDPIFGDPNIDAAPPIWNPFTSSDDDVLDDESAPNIDLEFIVDIWEDGPHSLNYRMTGTVDFVTHGAFDSPEALLEHAVSFEQRACVWHGALPLAIKLEDGSRGKKGDVSRSLRWLFADLDWKHADAHADSNKLPTEAVVRAVTESFKPMPTHVIDSGHGLQVYWKLDRAVDHAEWDETAKRLKSMLVAAGITSPDRVTDRASVLRVPGTWNMKPDCEPVMVKVLESTGTEHSPETFKQAAPAPTAERERVAPPAATQSVSKHSQTEESPAAFIRRDGDGVTFTALLERHGFIIGDNLGNEGIDVTRPGKVGGTSGRVHTDIHGGQFLNLFTPNGPAKLYTVGKPGDGDPVCRSLSKWDAFVALEYGGDATAAGRAVRQQMNSNRSNISTTGLEFNDIDDRGDEQPSSTNATGLTIPSSSHNAPMAGVDGFRYTDAGNAARLLTAHGSLLRFVPMWRRWLVYDGARWKLDHADTFAAHFATGIGRTLIGQIDKVYQDDNARKSLIRAVSRAESAAGISATLQVASSVPGVAIDHESLDADPWLLNVKNGTVDLHTSELHAHNSTDLLTMVTAVAYDPEATAETWDRFLATVLPDPAVRRFVQRLAGLALLGAQPEHVLPILLGGGANGKSTMTGVMAKVLGDYSIVASRDLLLAMKHDAHPTAKADLFRRRFAHSGELPAGAKLNEAQVKELTGDDKIKARRMREDHWEFEPSHLLWLHANHRPSIEGTDDGIWRRVLLIPFDVQVPRSERDPDLARRIVAEEGSGVLRWMVDGLADYREGGLSIPAIVADATQSYRGESDTVAGFLTESGLTIDPKLELSTGDLLIIHGEWFAASGSSEPEKAHYQRVVLALKEKGVTSARSGSRGRFWRGVGATT
ncbi:phage/plasmid primase, P4 family [Ilumatobacter sp.]|uniref:phage/plasmid primase, P4 family n=1 Tax=Ilumatobacter sp. TaxID=1967498 RepID=UPI0037523B54